MPRPPLCATPTINLVNNRECPFQPWLILAGLPFLLQYLKAIPFFEKVKGLFHVKRVTHALCLLVIFSNAPIAFEMYASELVL